MKRNEASIWNSLIWFTLLGFLRPSIQLFLIPLYLLRIGPEQYGILSLVLVFSGISTAVSGLKLDAAANRFYFDYYKDRKALENYLGQIFTITLSISLLVFTLFYFSGPYLFSKVFTSEAVLFFPYGILAIGTALLRSCNGIYFAYLRNEVRIKEFVILNVFSILGILALQAIFILHFDWNILGILLGSLLPIAIVFIVNIIRNPWLIKFNFDFKLLKPSFLFGIGFLPSFFFVIFEKQIDKLFLERFLDLESVGIYTLLIGIVSLYRVFLRAFQNAIRPNVYESIKDSNAQTKQHVNKIFKLYSSIGIFALAGVYLLGNHLHLITDNPKYLKIVNYIPYAVAGTIPLIYLRFQILIVLFYKNTRMLSMVTLAKTIVVIIAMYFLIDHFGIYGAIMSLFLSSALYALVMYFMEQNESSGLLNYFPALIRSIPLLGMLAFSITYLSEVDKSWFSVLTFLLVSSILLYIERKSVILFLDSIKSRVR